MCMSSKLGFFNRATPTVVEPTVPDLLTVGTALPSHLTAVSALGLVVDGITA